MKTAELKNQSFSVKRTLFENLNLFVNDYRVLEFKENEFKDKKDMQIKVLTEFFNSPTWIKRMIRDLKSDNVLLLQDKEFGLIKSNELLIKFLESFFLINICFISIH